MGGGKGDRFDRRSGTGRGKGEAREGRGKYNWGDKTDGADTAATDEGADPAATEPTAEGAEEEVAAAPVEEEENTMSLSEYMAAQAAKKDAKFGKIEERKVEDD